MIVADIKNFETIKGYDLKHMEVVDTKIKTNLITRCPAIVIDTTDSFLVGDASQPIMTVQGWKSLDELSIGDKIPNPELEIMMEITNIFNGDMSEMIYIGTELGNYIYDGFIIKGE